MTTLFDVPAAYNQQLLVGATEAGNEGCGQELLWSRGFEGLPRGEGTHKSSGLLAKVIEGEIIPRLLLTHRNIAKGDPTGISNFRVAETESYVRMVLASEPTEINDNIEALLDSGVQPEVIFTEILAPVARKLGKFWEEDRCTFTEVTLGLSRLHQVLHEVARRNSVPRPTHRRAYFVPVPGEQHTFGLCMLEEFFRHAGWETATDYAPSTSAIIEMVAKRPLDVVGFSVSNRELMRPLADLIKKTHKAAFNRDIAVMVGGGFFINNPDSTVDLGPATVVSDAVNAVQAAENLVSRPPLLGESQKTSKVR